jgi:hypothetical protein
MDVVAAIMNDHRVLQGLFEELRGDVADRMVRIAEVRARLAAHGRAEDRYVYPAVRKLVPGEEHHGADEHRAIEAKLDAVAAATPAGFPAALEDLATAVRAHVEDEETRILPKLKAALSYRKRDDLGRRFESARHQELKRAGIDDTLTKEDLYIRAQHAGIPGRSSMSKEELARALLAAKVRN